MPHQLHWRQLTGGIVALVTIVLLTLVVLIFARVGSLHGKKVTLYVVTDEAPGILAGTEVWLAGEREGTVKDVSFRPPTTDTLARLLITTEFLKQGLSNVRRDSYAQIRPGGTMIGTPIVYISPGTTAAAGLKDGDTVYTRAQAAVGDLVQGIGTIGPEFAALGTATRELADKIDRPVGTIGNARVNGFEDLADVNAGMSSLSAKATRGNGTIANAMRTNLMARASRTMAAADSIHTVLTSSKGTLGRFSSDSTIVTKATHVLAELDTLRALVLSPVGTIAVMHSDSTLAKQLERQRVLLAALIKDVKSNPTRYIRF